MQYLTYLDELLSMPLLAISSLQVGFAPFNQFKGTTICAFVQPAVRVDGNSLATVRLDVNVHRGRLKRLEQPRNPHIE